MRYLSIVAGYWQNFFKEQGWYPLMVNNGLIMKNISRMTCLYLSSLWKKASRYGTCTFYLTIWKIEGFNKFSLCFWHISTKANSFLARRLTLTYLVSFSVRQNRLHAFISLCLNCLHFPVFVGNVPKIYGPCKSAPRNFFPWAGSGGLSSEDQKGLRWDWVANHNATDTIMIIGWEKRFTRNIS